MSSPCFAWYLLVCLPMFSPYTTQLVADELTVLVIANRSPHTSVLSELLAPHGVSIEAVTEGDISAQAFDAREFYKIIWFCAPSTYTGPTRHAVIDFLQQRSEPVYVLMTVSTPTERFKHDLQHLTDYTTSQKSFVAGVRAALPRANFMLGQDVIDAAGPSLWQTVIAGLAQGVVYAPEVPLYPQLIEDFLRICLQQLLRPHASAAYLFQGNQATSHQVVKALTDVVADLTKTTLVIQPLALTVAEPWELMVVNNTTSGSLEGMIKSYFNTNPPPRIELVESPQPQIRHTHLPKPDKKSATEAALMASAPSAPTVKPSGAAVSVVAPVLPIRKKPQKHEQKPRSKSLVPQPVAPPVQEPSPTHLESEVVRLFANQRAEHTQERVATVATTTKQVVRKQQRKRSSFLIGLVVISVASGILFLAGFFILTARWLEQGLQAYVFQAGGSLAYQSPPARLKQLSTAVALQAASYQSVLDLDQLVAPAQAATVAQNLLQYDQTRKDQATEVGLLFFQLVGSQDGDSTATSQRFFTSAQKSFEALTQIQVGLGELESEGLPAAQAALWKRFSDNITLWRKDVVVAQQLQPLFSTLVGQQQKRTYVVLLQNNQELRASGGFIQAVAFLTFDKGLLIDHSVYSVYELDAQLTANVTPPADLQKVLGEQRLFLRDSNWEADFPTNAKTISTLIEKSFGRPVDGVIALNLFTVEELLKELGPLDVPEFNEVITDRNLWERMEFHSEVQLVPAGDNKDYSAVVFRRLLQKLTTLPPEKAALFVEVMYQGLQTQQVLWTLTSPTEDATLATLGWTGALATPQCPSQFAEAECVIDTMAQVEANIGVNKANYHVKRETRHVSTVLPSLIRHTRTVTLTNTSQTNAWPQGPYKSYLRFFVPEAATFESILINGAPITAEQLTQEIVGTKEMVGVVTQTPIQQQTQITVTYSLPRPTSQPWSYVFFNQHQAGIKDTLRDYRLEYEPGISPSLIAPQAEASDGSIVFSPAENTHFFSAVTFK